METMNTPTIHTLKLSRQWFQAKEKGLKPWELRRTDDRNFKAGDLVRFIEVEGGAPTGRDSATVRIEWVLEGEPFSNLLPAGLCIFTHADVRRIDGAAGEVLDAYLDLRELVTSQDPDPVLEHYGTMRAEIAISLLAGALGRPYAFDPFAEPEVLEAQGFDEAARGRSLTRDMVEFLRTAARGNTEPDELQREAHELLNRLAPGGAHA